jgi:hypothetical protein
MFFLPRSCATTQLLQPRTAVPTAPGGMAVVVHPAQIFDALAERYSRLLWVSDSSIHAYPDVRAAKLERRARETIDAEGRTKTKDWWGNDKLLLSYNKARYEEEQLAKEKAKTAIAAKTQPPPRKDVYVKGAQEWEKNAWKVWDKKKVQEDNRRDRYSTALTSYLAGNKLVHRFEPPAVTQCAHCDIGGGIHPLRRCMGCMAVAYCCRLHQKKHWEWHKHICFAIRAANNLEAKRGEGAGWCKLRPRRWRRPPIELGCVVETNCRARWANWKQFYTNGAQSMLNQMGDGGPFVFKEWDEAVASMAMCEEATFVFSVGATQRAMMPFVACRKAPPGTVLVVEVGLINVKRDNGRRQEVNDFLCQKFIAEMRQKKLDRLDEQKFMRLRMKQDRKDKADTVMKLLKNNLEKVEELTQQQKDSEAPGVIDDTASGADTAAAVPPAMSHPSSTRAHKDSSVDREEWEEEPEMDYEGFGEGADLFAQEGDADAEPLNLPSAFDDESDAMPSGGEEVESFFTVLDDDKVAPFLAAESFEGAKRGYVFKKGGSGLGYYRDVVRAPWLDDAPESGQAALVAPWDTQTKSGPLSVSAPPPSSNDPWASIDAMDSRASAKRTQATLPKAAPVAGLPPSPSTGCPTPMASKNGSMRSVLEAVGLGSFAAAFDGSGMGDASVVAQMQRQDPAVCPTLRMPIALASPCMPASQ